VVQDDRVRKFVHAVTGLFWSPSEKDLHHKWLKSFVKTYDSGSVCCQVLSSDPARFVKMYLSQYADKGEAVWQMVVLFSSQTLAKLAKQQDRVFSESEVQFMVEMLVRYSRPPFLNQQVVTQLCIGIVHLYLVKDPPGLFSCCSGLPRLLAVQLLTIVTEEVIIYRAKPKREEFRQVLSTQADHVFMFLASMATGYVNENDFIGICAVMTCWSAWIDLSLFSVGHLLDISNFCLNLTVNPCEKVTQAYLDVLRGLANAENGDSSLFPSYVSHIKALQKGVAKLIEGPSKGIDVETFAVNITDSMVCLAQYLIEKDYVDDEVAEAVLQITILQGHFDVSMAAFPFWYACCNYMGKTKCQTVKTKLQEWHERALLYVTRHPAVFPKDQVYKGWSKSFREAFKVYRRAVRDLLRSLRKQPEGVHRLLEWVAQEIIQWAKKIKASFPLSVTYVVEWEPLESAIHSASAIARDAPPNSLGSLQNALEAFLSIISEPHVRIHRVLLRTISIFGLVIAKSPFSMDIPAMTDNLLQLATYGLHVPEEDTYYPFRDGTEHSCAIILTNVSPPQGHGIGKFYNNIRQLYLRECDVFSQETVDEQESFVNLHKIDTPGPHLSATSLLLVFRSLVLSADSEADLLSLFSPCEKWIQTCHDPQLPYYGFIFLSKAFRSLRELQVPFPLGIEIETTFATARSIVESRYHGASTCVQGQEINGRPVLGALMDSALQFLASIAHICFRHNIEEPICTHFIEPSRGLVASSMQHFFTERPNEGNQLAVLEFYASLVRIPLPVGHQLVQVLCMACESIAQQVNKEFISSEVASRSFALFAFCLKTWCVQTDTNSTTLGGGPDHIASFAATTMKVTLESAHMHDDIALQVCKFHKVFLVGSSSDSINVFANVACFKPWWINYRGHIVNQLGVGMILLRSLLLPNWPSWALDRVSLNVLAINGQYQSTFKNWVKVAIDSPQFHQSPKVKNEFLENLSTQNLPPQKYKSLIKKFWGGKRKGSVRDRPKEQCRGSSF